MTDPEHSITSENSNLELSQSSIRSTDVSDSEAGEHSEHEVFDEDSSIDAEFRKNFEDVKNEYEKLKIESGNIIRRLLEEFQNLGFDDSSSVSTAVETPDKYTAALDNYEQKRLQYEEIKAKYTAEQKSLDQQMIESNRRIDERAKEFFQFRQKIALKSVMPKTNKPLPMANLKIKEQELQKKEDLLREVRVNYIRTKNKYKQTEDELNQQDQLSEGLHLIDFEQLKIENQSLNEKKSEKEQDLDRIKEKITKNAHALTHVQEKLFYVKKQRISLEEELASIDKQYTESRSVLAAAKNHRDKVRDDNSNLKKSSGLIGMNDLLYDFENRSNELELMQDRVTELKRKYQDLMSIQHELEAKIAQRQPLDQNLSRMNR